MGTLVTDFEINILDGMYGGDIRRDASSKIRGFIFQDLLAIEYLLNEEVEYVCSEYLEDVDAFFYDGRLEIAQAKHYPSTTPNMYDIETDLYYQYLRLNLLNSKLNVIPVLVIHRKQNVSELSIQQLKDEIDPPKNILTNDLTDIEDWLTSEVYVLDKKEQKKKLFSSFSSDSSVESFVKDFKLVKKKSLMEYQTELKEKLFRTFVIPSAFVAKEDNQKEILLGLAMEYVQRRYNLNALSFKDVRIDRKEFYDEIRLRIQICDDKYVAAYLQGIATELYCEIVDANLDISENQNNILNTIFSFTLEWLGVAGKGIEGQLQILNTLSNRSTDNVQSYQNKDVVERLLAIAECYYPIRQFLRSFWKIIYDICLGKTDFDITRDIQMMNPKEYILSTESRYICLKFPDECALTSAILYAEVDDPVGSRKRLCKRMMSFKPEKWFLRGNEKGKYDYDYSTADILLGDSVTDVGCDSFKIECLKCIKVGSSEWSKPEKCEDCIFSKSCVEG